MRSGFDQPQLFTQSWGWTGFYRPGVWACASAIGKSTPIANLNEDYQIQSAMRLSEKLADLSLRKNLLMEAEDWRQSEKQKLVAWNKKGRLLEKVFFQDTWSFGGRQTLIKFLPPRVRRKIAAPV